MGSDIRYNSFARSLETAYWSETSLPLDEEDVEDDIFLLLLPIMSTSTAIVVVVFLMAVGEEGRSPMRFEYWVVAISIMLRMPSKTLDDK